MKDRWVKEWVEALQSAEVLRESLDEKDRDAWWW